MYKRTKPPFDTLGAFLRHFEEQGQVCTVTPDVSLNVEATEIHRRVIEQGGPVLKFTSPVAVNGARPSLPLVTNVFGTKERVAAGLGCMPEDLSALGELMAFLRSPKPPKGLRGMWDALPVAKAALASRPKKVGPSRQLHDLPLDLEELPVQTCWPDDAGPLITWGIVITRPPGEDDPSTYNLGIYRVQVIDGDNAILRWLAMRGGAAHHRLWAERGEPMPVATVIGADPATILAAVLPTPSDVTELTIAGLLSGKRPELVPCSTIPLHVPASSEVVIEGFAAATETAPEGPFGDHTGYYNESEEFPLYTITKIRARKDAVYMSTFTGRAPDEPAVLSETMNDVFLPLLKQQLPEVVDLWLPPEAASYRIAVLKIKKSYAGQAKRVMMGMWSLLPQFTMTKMIITVDEDIDCRSWSDVMWAVATRMDPSRDLTVIDRTAVDTLDFSSPLEGLGGKLGIDATKKIGTETTRDWAQRIIMPEEMARAVEKRWDELFPDGLPGVKKGRE
ncbi:UbiD family decarboxylase [Pseudovibrio exalbescens]|uniref:UbiD family decarboxylase n=1 Tax=Pseudovibrio exalbescens TaxID=197461 RepID=UPI002366C2DA|nr:UbiD family decarboxylase [Pseudovibrio exalbescens]MDD7909879.1 UbiD family decarboxylase [Pseudovibrio exalbescens]